MTKELSKLKTVLIGFQKDRYQIDLAKKIFESVNCPVSVLCIKLPNLK